MANKINFSKTSGVYAVTSGSNPPKYFYGASGSFSQTPDGTGYLVVIGSQSFTVALADITINGQSPANIANGQTLLNALFGT